MRRSAATVVLAVLACAFSWAYAAAPAPTDEQAQQAHASGQCGSLGPGTGLGPDGRGWVVSMLPGPHEFRLAGGGAVGVTVQRKTRLDLDAGRPYYIVTDRSNGELEWKVPGREWGRVSKLFLYPPSGNPYRQTPP